MQRSHLSSARCMPTISGVADSGLATTEAELQSTRWAQIANVTFVHAVPVADATEGAGREQWSGEAMVLQVQQARSAPCR